MIDKDIEIVRLNLVIEELKTKVNKYKYDHLTGLKQRSDFKELCHSRFEDYLHNRSDFILILIDLNGLHTVNREQGYRAGDDFILGTATKIKAFLAVD